MSFWCCTRIPTFVLRSAVLIQHRGEDEGRRTIWLCLLDGELLFDVKFFDAFAEGGAGDAQEFGGLNLVALGLNERLDDQLAFHGGNDFEFAVFASPFKEGA